MKSERNSLVQHLYLAMKSYSVLIILLLSFVPLVAQKQVIPLSQTDYVRELYVVEKDPSKLTDLVEMVRVRGIDFPLTSGLRTLTKSKSKNDSELQRTIEEANRRRLNPESAKRPAPGDALALIEKTRQNTLAAVEEMPDFVVKQRIRRSVAYSGTNNFQGLDRLIVAVSYRADGREEYRLLSQNGLDKTDSRAKGNYSEVGGTSSTGEFVTVLQTVFDRASETRFEFVDTDFLRNTNTLVFDFSIDKDKAKQLITSYGYIADSTISGMKGRIWIDRTKGRVLRLDTKATQIPSDFAVTAASRLIDYDWVSINDVTYLLPISSDVRLTFRENRRSYESKNYIEFKDYQKYGAEVTILDDDAEFVDEDVEPATPVDPNAPPPLKKPTPPKKD